MPNPKCWREREEGAKKNVEMREEVSRIV